MKTLFRNKQYLFLICAQIVSSLGDWLNILALLILAGVDFHASPLGITLLMLCFSIPMTLFGPFTGVFADRYDRKKLMVAADLIRAAAVFGIVFAPALWTVYILVFLQSSFSALFTPAKNGKLKEIIPDDQMQQAVTISAMIDQVSKIIGPVLSGLLISAFSTKASFYIDAATFILSAIFLSQLTISVPKRISENHSKKKNRIFHDMMDGFSFIRSIPILLLGLCVLSSVLLVLQIADNQIIILLREVPHSPVKIFGYAMAASGAGMFIMSIILAKKEIKSAHAFISIGSVGIGAGYALMVYLVHQPVNIIMACLPLLGMLVGMSAAAVFIPFNVMAQKTTPVNLSGRIFGTINSMTSGAAIIGMVLGGILVELFGADTTFLLSGSFLIIIGIAAILSTVFLKGSDMFAKGNQGSQKKAQG
ncbi:MFS transporter [Falsibacillus albus]|uniref:MFS transporter n=1 Tax=Falsibacillus albus TaxID=2478915 RepID=A0A3L7JRJ8_9BACI|nr:MFS transporter [Falsibacillus albus]RLQ93296.1 MFS transporter [Falsibacillus albus]